MKQKEMGSAVISSFAVISVLLFLCCYFCAVISVLLFLCCYFCAVSYVLLFLWYTAFIHV